SRPCSAARKRPRAHSGGTLGRRDADCVSASAPGMPSASGGPAWSRVAALGWAPKGERCRAAIPHGHWKTITFVGGLTLTGFLAPHAPRRADERRMLPRLGRTDARTNFAAGPRGRYGQFARP